MEEQVPEEGVSLLAVEAEEDLVPEVLAEAAGEEGARRLPAHAHTPHQLARYVHLAHNTFRII